MSNFSILNFQFSIPSGADVTREVCQIVRTGDHIRVLDRNSKQMLSFRARSLDADECRIGELSLRDILARGLAERGRVGFDVEEVVDDLEGETGGMTVAAERVDLRVACAGEDAAEDDGGGEQLA